MKETFKKFIRVSKIIFQMIFNPKLLFCFLLGWMITNGFAYIALGIGIWCEIEWLTAVSSGYLAILWLPMTPEKIVSVALAMAFLRLFFPKDTKTLGVLRDILDKLKTKFRNEQKGNLTDEEK